MLAFGKTAHVKKGRRGSNNNAVSAEGVDSLLGRGNGSLEVVLPDVTAGDETKGELKLGVLNSREDTLELASSLVKVNVESLDGELFEELDVAVEATEVCS